MDSIRMEPDNRGAASSLVNQTEKHRFTDYQSLTRWVHGGSTGGQQVSIYLT
ncbi:MAG: hypothetical protein IPG63_17660 [Xanthomonadales bacterium]|nr:hypothetical protein [Xanthomonadales bacterium]